MSLLKSILRRIPLKRADISETDIEQLRTVFQERYHHFKLLLNANNAALDLMAELEEAMKGAKPFGMAFVRSRCTGLSTNVYQIIKHLTELTRGNMIRCMEDTGISRIRYSN